MNQSRDLRAALRTGRLPAGGPVEWRAFELAAGFSSGQASAYPRYWNGSQWTTRADPDAAFDVFDPADPPVLEGRYRDQFAFPHDQGSIGIARCPADSRRWEVLELTPAADFVGGDLAVGTGGLTLSNPVLLGSIGGILLDDPGAPIPVLDDLFGWAPTGPGRAVAVRRSGVWQLFLVVPIPAAKIR